MFQENSCIPIGLLASTSGCTERDSPPYTIVLLFAVASGLAADAEPASGEIAVLVVLFPIIMHEIFGGGGGGSCLTARSGITEFHRMRYR